MHWLKEFLDQPTEPYCPVCGYYCLGKGGMECIDKPMIITEKRLSDEQKAGEDA